MLDLAKLAVPKSEMEIVFGSFKSSESLAIDSMISGGAFCYENFVKRLLRAFLVEIASSSLLTKT